MQEAAGAAREAGDGSREAEDAAEQRYLKSRVCPIQQGVETSAEQKAPRPTEALGRCPPTPQTETFYQSCSPPPVCVSEDREVQEAAEATQKLTLQTSSNGNLSDSAAEITEAASIDDAAN